MYLTKMVDIGKMKIIVQENTVETADVKYG